MKVEYEIFQLISSSSESKLMLSEQASRGLAAYVADNGLEKLLEQVPAEKRRRSLELFMRPILSLPPKEILRYFETYDLRLAFTRTMNKIQSEALKKLQNSGYQCVCLSNLRDEFNSAVSELYGYPEMHERLSKKISDCIVDLDYIAGKSQNFSLSLSHRAGLQM